MKKVLVTGADGFIGSHLTEALVERGCDVRAFVFYNSFNHWGWIDSFGQNVKDRLDGMYNKFIVGGSVIKPSDVRGAIKTLNSVILNYNDYPTKRAEKYVDTLAPIRGDVVKQFGKDNMVDYFAGIFDEKMPLQSESGVVDFKPIGGVEVVGEGGVGAGPQGAGSGPHEGFELD